MALFTFNGANGTIDKSPRGLTPAVSRSITFAPGPFGNPNGSFFFSGNKNSFVKMKNIGEIDARFSISIFAWVFLDNSSGIIYKYEKSNYDGCLMKVIPTNSAIQVQYVNRRGSARFVLYKSNVLKANAWNFVGTTYDFHTGLATVFVNSSIVEESKIIRMELATHYNLTVGAAQINNAYFRGRIACLQVYDQALSEDQIMKIKTRCNQTSEYNN